MGDVPKREATRANMLRDVAVVTTGALLAIIIWHLAVWTWGKDPGMVVLTVFIAAVLPLTYLFHFDDQDQRPVERPGSDQ